MLAYILALAIVIGSFAIYMAAFFFPEVHRKGDIFWSGVGLFYALVLWFCAGRITGAVLLGQTASVGLLVWFGWQSMRLRWEVTPARQRTQVQVKDQKTGLSKLTAGLTGLFKGKPKTQKPQATKPDTKAEKDPKQESETPAQPTETAIDQTQLSEAATVAVDATTGETQRDTELETIVEETEVPAGTAEQKPDEDLATESSESEIGSTEEMAIAEPAVSLEQPDAEPDLGEKIAETTTQSTEEIDDELDEEWETGTSEEPTRSQFTDSLKGASDGATTSQEASLDSLEAGDRDTKDQTEVTTKKETKAKTKQDKKSKPAAKSTTGVTNKILAPIAGLFVTIQGLFKKDKKDKTSQNQPNPNQSETPEAQPDTSESTSQPEPEKTVEIIDQIAESPETLELDEVAIAPSQTPVGEPEPEKTLEDTATATTDETNAPAEVTDIQESDVNPEVLEVVVESENLGSNPEVLEVVVESENLESNPEVLEVVVESENLESNPEVLEVVTELQYSLTEPETEASEVVTEIQDSSTEIQADESIVNQSDVPAVSEPEVSGEDGNSKPQTESRPQNQSAIEQESSNSTTEKIGESNTPANSENLDSSSEQTEQIAEPHQKDQKQNSEE